MNENEKKDLIKVTSEVFNDLSVEAKANAEKFLSSVRGVTGATEAQAMVRSKLSEGMVFEVNGIFCSKFVPQATADNPNPTPIYTLYVTTTGGARVKADYFQGVKHDVSIGITDEEVAKFAAYHSEKHTQFVLHEYSPRKGRYGDDNYRAESGAVKIK